MFKKIKICDIISASVLVKELGGVTLTDGRSWSTVRWTEGQNENTRKRPGSCVALSVFVPASGPRIDRRRTARDWSRCVFLAFTTATARVACENHVGDSCLEWTLPCAFIFSTVMSYLLTQRERILLSQRKRRSIAHLIWKHSNIFRYHDQLFNIPEWNLFCWCFSIRTCLNEKYARSSLLMNSFRFGSEIVAYSRPKVFLCAKWFAIFIFLIIIFFLL